MQCVGRHGISFVIESQSFVHILNPLYAVWLTIQPSIVCMYNLIRNSRLLINCSHLQRYNSNYKLTSSLKFSGLNLLPSELLIKSYSIFDLKKIYRLNSFQFFYPFTDATTADIEGDVILNFNRIQIWNSQLFTWNRDKQLSMVSILRRLSYTAL